MKRLLFAALLILLVNPLAFGAEIPDYKRDKAEVVLTIVCDQGKASTTIYRHGNEYEVGFTVLSSGDRFIEVGYQDGKNYFFFQAEHAATPQELSHEGWDAKLKSLSQNAYNDFHQSGPNDCKKK